MRCWQIAGTYCGGKVQGEFVEKYGNCKKCDIYRAACPTIVEELGEGINNFLHLMRKQKKYTVKQLNEINYLNKELASALENLDAKNQEIQEIVVTDKLTGLYNRNYLFTVLEDEIYRCQRYNSKLSLMMIDLDDFKSVNDEYGHLVGDKMLSALGSFLKLKLRKTDRSFRYGGEEFVIILPETEIAVANIIANRIREEYPKQVFTINENDNTKIIEISRTLSIGITYYKEGCTCQDLLKQADKALYEAKSQGKNKVIRYDLS
ncbi:MAG TPA: GGDEF domain-containing protein [Thermoguttaceae bacterium]